MTAQASNRYSTRIAESLADVQACQALRQLAFSRAEKTDGRLDQDAFDAICTHILVQEVETQSLVCCFRILPLSGGVEVGRSYSAQFYELSGLSNFTGPMVEMGRFCIHPAYCDPDILRIAWGEVTRYVDRNKIEMLFGCSSFRGTDAEAYLDVFAMLKDRHLAPQHWLPRVKAPAVFRFAQALRWRKPDAKLAMSRMPSLLRTYLMMGGWVSDHAVVDCHMDTLHVFTGLEINAIPPVRKRLLRAVEQ